MGNFIGLYCQWVFFKQQQDAKKVGESSYHIRMNSTNGRLDFLSLFVQAIV